jgi:predicted NBD/HSP70 family sugar kinase
MRFGAARGRADFVHLFIGDVIGAGVVVDNGRLATGRARPPAPRLADVAHLPLSRPALDPCACGRPGCLTSVAGDQALCARAARAGLPATRTPEHLLDRARGGDRTAERLLRDRARAVGEAVAVLFEFLAPARIFVAGTPLRIPAHLAEIRAEAARRAHVPLDAERVVVPSALDRHARVLSAATAVLERFYDDPVRVLAAVPPRSHPPSAPSGDLA